MAGWLAAHDDDDIDVILMILMMIVLLSVLFVLLKIVWQLILTPVRIEYCVVDVFKLCSNTLLIIITWMSF